MTQQYYHPIEKRMVDRPVEFRGSEEFDRELDRPESAAMTAELAVLEEQKLTSSPSVNVDFALEQYERNLALSAEQRWAGQERWQGRDNIERRMVRPLHCHEVMRRLQRAGVDARIDWEPGARVWLNPWSKAGRIGVNANVCEEGVKSAKTLTTLQYPWSYEYSVMRFNEYNVPTEERYRGWRTVLLELVRREAITEREALDAFGPAMGEVADFYLRQLKVYRTAKMGLIQ